MNSVLIELDSSTAQTVIEALAMMCHENQNSITYLEQKLRSAKTEEEKESIADEFVRNSL